MLIYTHKVHTYRCLFTFGLCLRECGDLCRTHTAHSRVCETFCFIFIHIFIRIRSVNLCIHCWREPFAFLSSRASGEHTPARVRLLFLVLRKVKTRRSCSWSFCPRTMRGSTTWLSLGVTKVRAFFSSEICEGRPPLCF